MKKDNNLLNEIKQAHLRRLSQKLNIIYKKNKNNNQTPPIKRVVRSKKTHRPIKVKPIKFNASAFISGGIGDVFAVESFLSNEQRETLSTIYYATNKNKFIKNLFDCLKYSYPKLQNHINLWEDFSKFWAFYSLEDYLIKNNNKDKKNIDIKSSKDLSIMTVFENIKNGEMTYNGSSFLKEKLTEINHLHTKEDYFIILPYSSDKRIIERDFSNHDWSQTLKILKKNKSKGVVINNEPDAVPDHPDLINLSHKTQICEAIELLKRSKGFIGIDSWLSVLAAKLFDEPYLQIKSNNVHCHENAAFYYAPHKKFKFVVENIDSSKG
jgi:hypothetical protein